MHVRRCMLHSPFAGQPLTNDTKLHFVLAIKQHNRVITKLLQLLLYHTR
jgi:hypothetical protein